MVVDTTNWILNVADGVTVGGYNMVGATATQTLTNKTYNGVSLSVSGNVTANYLLGNAALVTGLSSTSITSGNSNVSILSSGGNVLVGVGGANIARFTSAGIENGQANGTGNIGTATTYFNTVFAKATSAQYADLAEMYVTDKKYDNGTVVAVGGEKEVTACSVNDIAIGVVSAKPAFLMNEKLPGQAIALKGRIPVKVSGPVTKGAGLIAGNNGAAITTYHAGNCPDSLPAAAFLQRTFAVSMEDNDDPDVKLVECVIL
jgi:hypothetical protein